MIYFAVSIKVKLPFDFAWVVCTFGICLFNALYSITSLFVSVKGAPDLLFLGPTVIGAAYGLTDLSISPTSNRFSISSLQIYGVSKIKGVVCWQQGLFLDLFL